MLTENIKKYFLPALLITAFAISFLKPSTDSITLVARKMQTKLNAAEESFAKSARGTSLKQELAKGNKTAPFIEEFEAKGISLFYYKSDTLTHWTSNNVLPLSSPASIEDGTSLIKLRNGWYQSLKWNDSVTNETILGIIPVKYEYPFENKFLKNDFALGLKVPHNIELSDQKIEGSVPVKNLKGETLFSLYISGDEKEGNINLLLLLAQLVFTLLAFYYIHRIAIILTQKHGFPIGFSVFLLFVIAARTIMLLFNLPDELNKLALFDPKYYASSAITRSLGDLVINTLLMLWVTFFCNSHYRKKPNASESSVIIKFIGLVLIFAYTGFILWVFKTLVMDSVISFEIYNVLSTDIYSLLGFICVALLLLIHFLFTKAVLYSLSKSEPRNYVVILFSVAGGLAFAAFGIGSPFYEAIFYSALWITLAVILLYFQLRK